jgi:hypothetical protein
MELQLESFQKQAIWLEMTEYKRKYLNVLEDIETYKSKTEKDLIYYQAFHKKVMIINVDS